MIEAVEIDNLFEHVLQVLTRDHSSILIPIDIWSVPHIVPICVVGYSACEAQVVLLARDVCLHRSDSGLHRCDSGLHRRYVSLQGRDGGLLLRDSLVEHRDQCDRFRHRGTIPELEVARGDRRRGDDLAFSIRSHVG